MTPPPTSARTRARRRAVRPGKAAGPAGPAGPASHAWSKSGGTVDLGGTTDVLTLDLPAGKYLLFANVTFVQRDGDSNSEAACGAANGALFVTMPGDEQAFASGSLIASIDHPGGPVKLQCTETLANIDINSSDFYAIQVGAFN